MAIFNSYVSLPEGTYTPQTWRMGTLRLAKGRREVPRAEELPRAQRDPRAEALREVPEIGHALEVQTRRC